MNKRLLATAIATLMTSGIATAAAAQDAPPPPGPGGMLVRADADHDGVITRDEYVADTDRRFGMMDTNHDGKITAEEREAVRAAMMARGGGDGPGRGMGGGMGNRADTNGDGAVSIEEQRAQAAQRFDRIDANHDGKIDQVEQDQIRSMGGRRGPPPPPPGGMPPPPPPPPPPPG